jgi:two-component system, sensor histidine kinase and response regulator
MNNSKTPHSDLMVPPAATPPGESAGFYSLRTKFSVFVSLVIILVCGGLSAYLIHQASERMKGSLINTGTILVKTLARVSSHRLIIRDMDYLETMMEGTLSGREMVYALVTDAKGNILVSQSKGPLKETRTLLRDQTQPLFPDPQLLLERLQEPPGVPPSEPWVTVLHTNREHPTILFPIQSRKPAKGSQRIVEETIYDFAFPVFLSPQRSKTLELLLSETMDPDESQTPSQPLMVGVIQVGVTTAVLQQVFHDTVWNIGLITVGISLIGIVLTTLLTNRIVTPLRRLAGAAEKIAGGDLEIAIRPQSGDEVGQLTASLNAMVDSLQQREIAISHYVSTITKQVTQLSTLHQTSTAITATLDIDRLLPTVLKYLHQNLGFQRMVLVLLDPSIERAVVTEVLGLPPELEQQIRGMTFPLMKGTSLDQRILVEGRPTLVAKLEHVASRINPAILPILHQLGVTSFVVAPLISHQRILGYLGGDKGNVPSRQEDLDLLMTVAGHVAVAIDNARAYQDLENLAQTLERRINERTLDLQAANERLQELDRLKSAFVSIVSHELRTPMTSIKGLVENMLDGLTGTINERQTFYLGRVRHNIERLTRMINDLLDLSRIEAGRMELRKTTVNLGSLAREVVELFQNYAGEQSLSLEALVEDGLPAIQGDRDKLTQVLTNLVNNALKFTDPQGTVTVTVSQAEAGWIQTCVSDTGCGISPDDQAKLFEPFVRSQSTLSKTPGAGLGLAISKSLLELHGGEIWVESTPGVGSQFCFKLPVSDPSQQDEPEPRLQ